jgi:hypothetical protein
MLEFIQYFTHLEFDNPSDAFFNILFHPLPLHDLATLTGNRSTADPSIVDSAQNSIQGHVEQNPSSSGSLPKSVSSAVRPIGSNSSVAFRKGSTRSGREVPILLGFDSTVDVGDVCVSSELQGV